MKYILGSVDVILHLLICFGNDVVGCGDQQHFTPFDELGVIGIPLNAEQPHCLSLPSFVRVMDSCDPVVGLEQTRNSHTHTTASN